MSWHCSQALVAEFSERGCLDGESCALLSEMRSVERRSYGAKKKAYSPRFRSGTTFAHSTAQRGVEAWMSSLRASHASHSPSPASVRERWTNAISGLTPFAFSATCPQGMPCWRTCQGSFLPDTSAQSCTTFARAGMMLAGKLYQRPSWERRTSEIDYGLWPTVNAADASGSRGSKGKDRPDEGGLAKHVKMFPTPAARDWRSGKASNATMQRNSRPLNEIVSHGGTSTRRAWTTPCADDTGHRGKRYERGGTALSTQAQGQLNPSWVEWLMGWPIGWTALEPLGMDRFRQWLEQHGSC